MSTATGNLSIEAQTRYAYVERLLTADFKPPATVVELGAAPGDQIARLATLGYKATSVDIGISSDAWSDSESGRMTRLLAEAGANEVTWNLEEVPYPFADGSFDAVIMTEVFEHLRDYPIRSLNEVARVLRPGGRLYLTTPNQAYLMNRLRLLTGRNVQTPLGDWIAGMPFARHAREYTFGEMVELMRHAGLSIVLLESRHFHIDVGRQGIVSRVGKSALGRIARARPSLGPQIICVAEKS